jgi:hypothetical protein
LALFTNLRGGQVFEGCGSGGHGLCGRKILPRMSGCDNRRANLSFASWGSLGTDFEVR